MRTHKTLVAWQRANWVAGEVFALCKQYWCPSAGAAFNQLQRASLSVQLNISEGYALGSKPAFRRHLTIAYGSSIETLDLLEFLEEKEVISPVVIKPIIAQAKECQALVLALLKRIRDH